MKSRTHLAVFAALFVASIAVPTSLHAATLYVGSCGGPNKPTIQAAVNASSPGDTVLVCPGTYPEQVTITKDLILQGPDCRYCRTGRDHVACGGRSGQYV